MKKGTQACTYTENMKPPDYSDDQIEDLLCFFSGLVICLFFLLLQIVKGILAPGKKEIWDETVTLHM